jgi:hypothetical protein
MWDNDKLLGDSSSFTDKSLESLNSSSTKVCFDLFVAWVTLRPCSFGTGGCGMVFEMEI